MKKKLITISDELFKIIQKNAEASELTLMEEIRQTLKTGARYRKKALGVPEHEIKRLEETPKATSNISKEVPQENTVFLDDFTDDDIKDTVAAAKEAYHL